MAASFTTSPWPDDAMATIDEVATADGTTVVDSRAPERYRGDTEPVDPRAGHIPGAINLPFNDNLNKTGRFLSTEDLRSRFTEAGVDKDSIIHCGSGVSACRNVLAIEAAGLGRPRLYVGSWSEWSGDETRDAATGE